MCRGYFPLKRVKKKPEQITGCKLQRNIERVLCIIHYSNDESNHCCGVISLKKNRFKAFEMFLLFFFLRGTRKELHTRLLRERTSDTCLSSHHATYRISWLNGQLLRNRRDWYFTDRDKFSLVRLSRFYTVEMFLVRSVSLRLWNDASRIYNYTYNYGQILTTRVRVLPVLPCATQRMNRVKEVSGETIEFIWFIHCTWMIFTAVGSSVSLFTKIV